MIQINSRYRTAEIGYVLDGRSGVTRATVFRERIEPTDQYDFWIWSDGDRLDLLAQRFYGKSGDWWRILDANPEVTDPATIPLGFHLRVPR